MGQLAVTIDACLPDQIEDVRSLFKEYADAIGVGLCFQDFESELESLLGCYAPPDGRLLVATDGSALVGCVALKRLSDDICEMKRLYVRPSYKGNGLGRRLSVAIIEAGREIGYSRMRLDTLSTMTAAISLYRSLGFVEIDAYYGNSLADVMYLELDLRGWCGATDGVGRLL